MRLNYNAYKSNKKLLFSVILLVISVGVMLPVVMIFFNNWIYSYKHSKTHLNNSLTMQECLFLIQYHNIVGCILSSATAMTIGKYTDKMQPKVSICLGYLLGVFTLVAMYFTEPGKWFFYVSAPLLHVVMHAKMIAIRSYSMRMFPVEIRSTLLGNISFGIALCTMIMIQVYDFAFHSLGSSSPFIIAAIIDVAMMILIFVFDSKGLIESQFE